MPVYRPRRPLAKLSICLACAMLASCELPHAIAAEQPFTPVLAPSRPPVVMVLTAPIPLPRWVEAAAVASPTGHFFGDDPAAPGSAPIAPAEAAVAPAAAVVSSGADSAPAPVVSAKPKPVVDDVKSIPDASRSRPEPTDQAVADPVIQIATPSYFDRPTPSAAAAAPARANKAASAAAIPPDSGATTADAAALPGLPSASALAPATHPSAFETTATVTPEPASPVIASTAVPPAEVVPLADPVPLKTPPPAPVVTARAEPAAVASPPSPSLQITGGRFAGMPLPNLPPLTPEPETALDSAAPAAKTQTARSDEPLPSAAAAASSADDATAAQSELRRASERTGLNDLQLARIEESRRLIADGNFALALDLSRKLNAELEVASTRYIVKGSETLWQIAELPQVYGNAYLWPLIWRANAQLRQPTDVQPGMSLRIPTHPAVLDVTAAIDYARRAGGEKMQPVRATD